MRSKKSRSFSQSKERRKTYRMKDCGPAAGKKNGLLSRIAGSAETDHSKLNRNVP